MPQREIKKLLADLHLELEKTPTLDDASRELLSRLAADIRSLLDESGESAADARETVADSLGEAEQSFEVSHPSLAALIRGIGDILAQGGI